MNVTALPTRTNIDQLWDRYSEIARRAVDNPELLIDRKYCEEFASAWTDFRDAYSRWGRK